MYLWIGAFKALHSEEWDKEHGGLQIYMQVKLRISWIQINFHNLGFAALWSPVTSPRVQKTDSATNYLQQKKKKETNWNLFKQGRCAHAPAINLRKNNVL